MKYCKHPTVFEIVQACSLGYYDGLRFFPSRGMGDSPWKNHKKIPMIGDRVPHLSQRIQNFRGIFMKSQALGGKHFFQNFLLFIRYLAFQCYIIYPNLSSTAFEIFVQKCGLVEDRHWIFLYNILGTMGSKMAQDDLEMAINLHLSTAGMYNAKSKNMWYFPKFGKY